MTQGYWLKLKAFLAFCVILTAISACTTWQPEPDEYIEINEVSSLQVRFFGVSTLLISDDDTSILFDGYFTRKGFKDMIMDKMISDESKVHYAFTEANLRFGDVAALFVSHAHYDHAMDSQFVALRLGAHLYGSPVSRKLFSTESSSYTNIVENKTYRFGSEDQFSIEAFETNHAVKHVILQKAEALFLEWSDGSNYGNGGPIYNFVVKHPCGKFLIVPSAGLSNKKNNYGDVDVVFLGMGLLSHMELDDIEKYWLDTVVNSDAETVIPIHWDNFTLPLSEPFESFPSFADDMEKTISHIRKIRDKYSPQVKIRYLAPIKPVAFDELFTVTKECSTK
jgi:L-ascorbate metabolism protein UlaG (beta-lactamase superfamily)